MFRNLDVRYALLLFVLSILLWLPRLTGPIDLRYDAGVYYILGSSLAEGKGYQLLNEPGDIAAIQYPPLLPAFAAVHQRLLGTSDPAVVGPWLRWSFALIFLVYIQAVYRMARLYLTTHAAFWVSAITLFHRQGIFLSDLFYAEIPFALVGTLFILVNHRNGSRRAFVLAAVLGSAAYLLRSAGVALLAAWVGESFLRRQWKQFTWRTAAACLPVLAWQGYIQHVTAHPDYRHPAYPYQRAPYQYNNVGYIDNLLLVDSFTPELGRLTLRTFAERVGSNLAVMPASLGEGASGGKTLWEFLLGRFLRERGLPVPPDWIVMLPLALVGCLVTAGAALWVVRRQWFIPLYIAASVGLICLTPWPGQFSRYLTPLTPLLAMALLLRLTTFQTYARQHWSICRQRWSLAAVVLVMLVVVGSESITGFYAFKFRQERGAVYTGSNDVTYRFFFYDDKWASVDRALTWLREAAQPGDRLATSVPHWAYLRTGRKAVIPPMEVDPDTAQELLESVPVHYVIVDKLEFVDLGRRYTAPVIGRYPDRWRLVFRVPDTDVRVYQRVTPSAGTK